MVFSHENSIYKNGKNRCNVCNVTYWTWRIKGLELSKRYGSVKVLTHRGWKYIVFSHVWRFVHIWLHFRILARLNSKTDSFRYHCLPQPCKIHQSNVWLHGPFSSFFPRLERHCSFRLGGCCYDCAVVMLLVDVDIRWYEIICRIKLARAWET